MNWFDKIKKKTEKSDDSRDLKRGEIKTILIDNFKEQIPDFPFLDYKNGVYFFERIRSIDNYEIYETFHLSFGLKDKNFSCSVSSTLNPTYRYVGTYNSGILTQHVDLIVLKKNKESIPIEEAYYFHNGKIDTTAKIVKTIVDDYKQYGLRFLDKRYNDLFDNKIFDKGLRLLENITIDKKVLKEQIEKELKQLDYVSSRLKNSVYLDMKEQLQAVPKQDKDLRQKIPGFAYSLLEYYWEKE